MANPNSLMNRSKSLADKKNSLDKKPLKPVDGGKKKKKMKFNSFLPFEPENTLHEEIEREQAFMRKA